MKDCPNGRLSRIQFVKIYEEMFPTHRAQRFCDMVFKVFDKNNTNTIGKFTGPVTCSLFSAIAQEVLGLFSDFRQFIMTCSLTRGELIGQLSILSLLSLIFAHSVHFFIARAIDEYAAPLGLSKPVANSFLTQDQMQKLSEAVQVLFEGAPITGFTSSMRTVDAIMKRYNQSHGCSITKDEFIAGISSDPEIAAFLSLCQQNVNRTQI